MREVHRDDEAVLLLVEVKDEDAPGDKAVLLDGVPPGGGYEESD